MESVSEEDQSEYEKRRPIRRARSDAKSGHSVWDSRRADRDRSPARRCRQRNDDDSNCDRGASRLRRECLTVHYEFTMIERLPRLNSL